MNWLSSLIRHNLLAKIIALIVAVVMWIFVMNDQNPIISSTVTVPVRLINASENYVISQDTDDVRLKVRASRSLLASYNVDDFDAYVDLGRAVEGENTLKISTVVPSGFELLDMSSETVKVNLDQIIERYVDVEVKAAGEIDQDTVLDSINIVSSKAVVRGPRSIMDRVYELNGSVDMTGKTESFQTSVGLIPIDRSGLEVEGVTLEDGKADVFVTVSRAKQKKMVSLHPVSAGELPAGLVLSSVKVEPQKVEISGESKLIANVETVNTQPIELDKIIGDTVLDVGLQLPEGITAENSTVQVSISVTVDSSSN